MYLNRGRKIVLSEQGSKGKRSMNWGGDLSARYGQEEAAGSKLHKERGEVQRQVSGSDRGIRTTPRPNYSPLRRLYLICAFRPRARVAGGGGGEGGGGFHQFQGLHAQLLIDQTALKYRRSSTHKTQARALLCPEKAHTTKIIIRQTHGHSPISPVPGRVHLFSNNAVPEPLHPCRRLHFSNNAFSGSSHPVFPT